MNLNPGSNVGVWLDIFLQTAYTFIKYYYNIKRKKYGKQY